MNKYEWTESGLAMLRDIQISMQKAGGIRELAMAIIAENPEYFGEESFELKMRRKKRRAKREKPTEAKKTSKRTKIIQIESFEDKIKRLSKTYTPGQISFLTSTPECIINKYLKAA